MPRIRTIKPEAFASESLAQVSVTAERTFFGLLTQADDHGRFRDQAAVIAGLLWSLRPEHGPLEVEEDLNQLASADLICRYEGDDNKRYLHIVTFRKHQKINRPSGKRHPACPRHDGGEPEAPSGDLQPGLNGTAVRAHGGLTERSMSHDGAGRNAFSESALNLHRSDPGPRNGDLGSVPSGGASAPAPDTVPAKQLLADYVRGCSQRPPSAFLGHLGKVIAGLVSDGIPPDQIRSGLERMRHKGLNPSTLPSLIHEVQNNPGTTAPAAHRPWSNPLDVEAAYGGEL